MIARSESWSARGLEGRRTAAAALLGAALFLGSFALVHVGPFGRHQIIDTHLYQRYGEAVMDGRVPYRDFRPEYPPGALPAFVIPSLAPTDDYRTVFEALMALCGVAAVVLVAVTLGSAGAAPARLFAATAFAGVASLALGPVVLTRYDLWPAALVAGAVAALGSDRPRLGLGLLAVAVAAKVYAFVLLPIGLVYIARRRGRRDALGALAVFAAVLAALVLPFAILGPDGLAEAFERQVDRPLQVESLGASTLLAAYDVGSYEPTIVSSFGSQNLVGGAPDALTTVQAALQAVAVVGVWVLFISRRGSREELFAASAAAVTAVVAFGKVLSPQFLIWLVPLVPLVAGRRGLAASGLLLTTLVLTQLWFPSRYWELVGLESLPIWLLLARNVLLIGLAGALAVAIARTGARSHSR